MQTSISFMFRMDIMTGWYHTSSEFTLEEECHLLNYHECSLWLTLIQTWFSTSKWTDKIIQSDFERKTGNWFFATVFFPLTMRAIKVGVCSVNFNYYFVCYLSRTSFFFFFSGQRGWRNLCKKLFAVLIKKKKKLNVKSVVN